MIYGHIATGERLKRENPKATDEDITQYMRGQSHRSYGWFPEMTSESYTRGYEGKPFKEGE